MAQLDVVSGPHTGQRFDLTPPLTEIGRAVQGVRLDYDQAVSRQHAHLVYDGSQWLIRDTGSQNGVAVNGMAVRESPVRSGDLIAVGGSVLRFSEPQAVGTQTAPIQAGAQMPQASSGPLSAGSATDNGKSWGYGCLALLVLVIWIGSCIGGGSPDPDYAEDANGLSKIDVYSMAHQFVEENLKAPSTAKFPWDADDHVVENLGNRQYRVSSWVDAQNGFGAMIRSDWTVVMTYQGNDRWTLDDIQLSEP